MAAWHRLHRCRNRSRPRCSSRHSTTALPPPVGQVDRQALVAERLPDAARPALRGPTSGMSILLTMIARGRLRSLAASIIRRVTTSMPFWALTTTATVSTAGRQAMAGPIRSGRAGRVDQVDPLALVVGVEDGGVDRVLVLLLLLLEIAEADAVGDRALCGDGAAGVEQGVGQRRLSAAAVAGEQDVADVSGGVGRHGGLLAQEVWTGGGARRRTPRPSTRIHPGLHEASHGGEQRLRND